MNTAEATTITTRRLPRQVVWSVVGLSVLPSLLNLLGVDFGVAGYDGPELGELGGLELADALHQALAGSLVHTLLEWSAFAIALFTVVLAYVHYSVSRDVAVVIIALALFLSGTVDGFHALAADRLIPAVADNARFIPFTWAISRTFHAIIAITGVTLFLVGRARMRYSPRFLAMTSVAFAVLAYLTIHFTATSSRLPVTEFADAFVKRPYDVLPLVLFLLAGLWLYPRFLAERPSIFAHALLVGVIPEVATQLHMVFWSRALFDNSFNIAHFLKILAYAVPFTGLALDYVRSHKERNRLDLALQHSTERLDHAQATERRLQEQFDDAPMMYVVVSVAEGPAVVTDCNMRFLSSLGYQREEIVGKRLDEFYDAPSKSALAVRLEADAFTPGEGAFQAEQRGLIRRDGQILRVVVWLVPIRDADETVTGARLVYTDVSRQARAEQALDEVLRLYEALVQSATDLIQTTDTEGHLVLINDTWLETLGYAEAEVVGTDLFQFIAPEDHSHCRNALGRVQKGEQVDDVEVRFLTKDGNMIDLRGTVLPRFEAGVVTGSYGYFRDVTQELVERRERTEQAERNRKQNSEILGIATHPALREGDLKQVTRMVTASLGHTVDVERASIWFLAQGRTELECLDLFELTPRKHSQPEVLAAKDYPRYFATLQEEGALDASDARSDPRTSEFTEGYLIPLGIASMLDVPIRVEGKVIGVVCLEHTGTPRVWRADEIRFASALADAVASVLLTRERSLAEAEATRTSNELRQLIETANAPIFGVDLAGRVDEWNNMAATISGYPKDEAMGKELVEFIAPEFRESVGQVLTQGLAGEERANYEFPLVTKSGDRVEILLNATTRRDLDGNVTGVVGVGQDITARNRALAELRDERASLARRVVERTADLSAANAELTRASRAKDEFLASMSHELRTPLNVILASSEALREEVYGPISDRQSESLELVEESGRHLLSLVNDILDLSKMEAGKLELELGPVDVGEICETSMRFVKEAAQKKRLKLTTSIDQQVGAVHADGRRLKQMLVNLLTNAVKFTPEGGQVGLEVIGDADQEVVRFSVWDTGIGIPQEHMTRLFQPFMQLEAGLNRAYEGTGLGLSLVSRMVELHGGSVTVESAGKGEGSRFTISLRWTPSAVAAVEPQEADAPPAPLRHALVVEDSRSAAELLERYLKEMDVSCTVLDRGERVLEVAAASRPDVILLDLLLPGESGWAVLAQLKADPHTRDIPVVITSVVEERVRGLELGAQEYLVKPFTRDELHTALQISVTDHDASMPTSALVISAEPESESEAAPLVLIAEDNEANIRSMSGYLVAKGFRLAVARNGGEAVDQTRELRPDLILMDIQMPGVDGMEATRQIREDSEFSSIPIIALTALAMPGDRERVLEAGANEYMAKPVSLRALVETMRTLLSRPAEMP